ncbi:MAG: class I SAM-dependent methyltransferase, partial [Betaproteobacteria bacterium]|nr:class I SAM-dependent methyltransferase [Betaproteobacteria bacterium]
MTQRNDNASEDLKRFDQIDPFHQGDNTVHMTRVQIADLVVADGHHRVLDVPAGSGALSYMLLSKGIDVVSADLFPEAFLVPGKSCLRVDLNEQLPFDDGTFDAIVCIEGIEHIESPHLLAREANRILRPGGNIYISTPNILSIRSRLSNLFRGYPNQFNFMVETGQSKGQSHAIGHINPIGFLELRYVLSR